MSPSNLAIVFAPNLLKSDLPQNHMEILQDSKYSNSLMTTLIESAELIFMQDEDGTTTSSTTNQQATTTTNPSSTLEGSPSSSNVRKPLPNAHFGNKRQGEGRRLPQPLPSSSMDSPPVLTDPYAAQKQSSSSNHPYSEPPVFEIVDFKTGKLRQSPMTPPPVMPNPYVTTKQPSTTRTTSPQMSPSTSTGNPFTYLSSSSLNQHIRLSSIDSNHDDDHEESNCREETPDDGNSTSNSTSAVIRKVKLPVRKRAAFVRDVRKALPNPQSYYSSTNSMSDTAMTHDTSTTTTTQPKSSTTLNSQRLSMRSVGYESDEGVVAEEDEA